MRLQHNIGDYNACQSIRKNNSIIKRYSRKSIRSSGKRMKKKTDIPKVFLV
jgi:hypothetical protein